MEGDITFDYSKAQSLLNVLDECKRGFDELSQMLTQDVSEVNQWWEGGSYDAFIEKYNGSGGVKSVINDASEKVKETIRFLNEISEAKNDFERKSEQLFR